MLLVTVPALLLYDATGLPGPFHVLAVVTLLTTCLGWLAGRRARGRHGVEAHAALMTWAVVGVTTAGLAQLANRVWPEHAPRPVVVVVLLTTATGLVVVPRWVSSQLARRAHVRSGPDATVCARR